MNQRNFYKVELIDQARAVFAAAVKHRPRGRYTIRQRCRVLEQWPERK